MSELPADLGVAIADIQKRLIEEHLQTKPKRQQLLLSMLNPLCLRLQYIDNALLRGETIPGFPVDWKKWASEFEMPSHNIELEEVYERIRALADDEEQAGEAFQTVGRLLGELQAARERIKARAATTA